MGSPWEPVVMMVILSFGYRLIKSMSIRIPSGTVRYPSSVAILTKLSILRPETATFRPSFVAASMICWMRWRLEENVAMMIRLFSAFLNRLAKLSPTTRSLGV